MGRGSYNGGSTIIGPWSAGWFSPSRSNGMAKSTGKKMARRIAAEERQEAARLARKKRKEMKAVPTPRRDPAKVTKRLAKPMKGVKVIRYTQRTLRMRKAKSSD